MPHNKDDSVIKEIPFMASTIETVDFAIHNWLDKKMDIYTTTNKGWKKVDVIWVSAERSYQAKKKRERRDKGGTVNFPLIMLERKSIVKDPARKGTAYGNVPHESDAKGGAAAVTIARRINQDKTSNFANADSKRRRGQLNFPRKNKKVVYETISVPMPVYVDVSYSILLRTQYQQQMNEVLQPFINRPGGINYQVISHDGHRYEAFIDQDFVQEGNTDNLGDEERKYETRITIKVLAYLLGEGKNDKQPRIVVRQNAVEVKTPRERIIVGDISEHNSDQGYIGIGGPGGLVSDD